MSVDAVLRDITERKKVEEQLSRSQKTFAELVERAPFGIYIVDSQFRIAHVNAASEDGAFRNVRPLIGRPLNEAMRILWPEPVATEIISHFRQTLETGEPYSSPPFFNPRHDVEIVEGYEWELHRMTLPDGQYGVICYYFDSTKLRQTEAALRESEERFRILTQNLQLAVALVDERGAFTIVNSAFLRMFDIPRDADILNINSRDWSQWKVFDEHGVPMGVNEHPVRRAALTRTAVQNQLVAVKSHSSPDLKWLLISAEPILDAQSKLHHLICTYYDITDRKRAEEALRESEERFRAMADSCPTPIWVTDAAGGNRFVNRKYREFFGVTIDQVEGSNWQPLIHPEDAPEYLAAVARSVRDCGPFQAEARVRRADGEWRRVASHGEPRWSPGGEFLGLGGMSLDVTESRQAEAALHESEKRLAADLDALERLHEIGTLFVREGNLAAVLGKIVDAAMAICASDFGNIQLLDPQSSRLKIAAYQGFPQWWVDYWDAVPRGQGACGTALERLERVIVEDVESSPIFAGTPGLEIQLKAGVRAVQCTPLVSRSGSPLGMLSTHYRTPHPPDDRTLRLLNLLARQAADIIERVQAEYAIAGAVQRLNAHMDNSPLAVVEFDPQFRVTRWSTEAEKLFGWRAEEILGRAIAEIRWVYEDDVEAVRQVSRDMLNGTRPRNLSVNRNYRKDGSIVESEWYNSAIYDAGGKLTSILSQVLDVTDRKRAEEAVRNSRQQLQDIIDGSPGVVFVKDLEGRFITANQTFERFLGVTREELRGKTDYDLTTRNRAEYYREHDRRVAETGEPIQVEEVADLADGRQHIFLANKFPLRDAGGKLYAVCTVSTDITERKQAEERLRQSQKLESIGLLAGGVAHDFNNLLVGVVGNASLAQDMLPPGHPVADLLAGVLKSGEQAAHLTRQMLAYSGKGKFVVELLDLSALIPEMSELVRPSIPKKINLRFDLEHELPAIEADRGQIQQVFMNLTLNAADAIGSQEGLITVRTGVQEVDESYMKLHQELAALAPGKYVYLEVRDTGCGMDEATKAKIFDPFFSTKFVGRGLGLAAVSGILRGHRSGITVSSAPGKGSCFTVLFPAAASTAGKGRVAVRDTSLQGAGTVLVVDDERVVLEMAKRALERHGYQVLMADSGLAAIDVFRRHPGEIALVVLDLSMPRMNGEEALPELRKIRPEVKVVVSSGYSESEAMALFEGQRVSGFVQKPYTAKGIAEEGEGLPRVRPQVRK